MSREKSLKYYRHKVDSHNHWKFKRLRSKYGWPGEGKFWALNNMIASSNLCKLDLSDDDKKEQIGADLDFSKEEFIEFLKYLVDNCKLIKNGDGFYYTESTQQDFEDWENSKKYDRERKKNQ